MDDTKTRYCFLVDWFDIHAQLTRHYELFYYPYDSTVEMYDVKQRRTFLKRTKSEFKLQDFFVGAVINVLSRQLTVRGFGDEYTRTHLELKLERALALIKPDAYAYMGEILDQIQQAGFSLCRLRMIRFNAGLAEQVLEHDYAKSPAFADAVASLDGGPALALDIIKSDGIRSLQRLVGPDSVEEAKKEAPSSLRARFGMTGLKNGIHVAHSLESAEQQLNILFGESSKKEIPRTAQFSNSTLLVIRPHALLSGLSGKILDSLLKAQFSVTDMELFQLDRANAEEFLEVYKGIVPEYHLMLDQLTSGPLIAMEISGADPTIGTRLREFAGPSDPELGKKIRPDSLRARFGVDKVKNAVHVTDLPEDGVLESQYFFRILAS